MGLMDTLKGIKRPEPGTAPLSPDELTSKILAMNHDEVPYRIERSEKSDLKVELKIVDAQWYEIFAKANLTKTYSIYLLLDEASLEVRALERMGEVKWKAGVPTISFSASGFQGRTIVAKEFGIGFAFKAPHPLSFGKVYEYQFNVNDIKEPLIEVITRSGWSYVPITSMKKVKRK